MKKYTLQFTGYCEVWAKSPEEAAEMADKGDMFFVECNFGEPTTDDDDEEECE